VNSFPKESLAVGTWGEITIYRLFLYCAGGTRRNLAASCTGKKLYVFVPLELSPNANRETSGIVRIRGIWQTGPVNRIFGDHLTAESDVGSRKRAGGFGGDIDASTPIQPGPLTTLNKRLHATMFSRFPFNRLNTPSSLS